LTGKMIETIHRHPSLVRHYVTEFGLAAVSAAGSPARIVVLVDPFKVTDARALWTTVENADVILRAASNIVAASPIIVSAAIIDDLIFATARALSIRLTPHVEMLARVQRGLDTIEGQFRDMRDKGGLRQANRKWRHDRQSGANVPKTYSAFAMDFRHKLVSELARKLLQ
jgi:hypothetical protein